MEFSNPLEFPGYEEKVDSVWERTGAFGSEKVATGTEQSAAIRAALVSVTPDF